VAVGPLQSESRTSRLLFLGLKTIHQGVQRTTSFGQELPAHRVQFVEDWILSHHRRRGK
jgi:hypothetical protein